MCKNRHLHTNMKTTLTACTGEFEALCVSVVLAQSPPSTRHSDTLDSQQSFAWAHAWLRHWNTNSLQTSHKNRLARRDVRASSHSDSQTCKVCSHSVTDIHAQFFLLPSNWFRLVLSHRQKLVSYQLIKHSQLQTKSVLLMKEAVMLCSLYISSHIIAMNLNVCGHTAKKRQSDISVGNSHHVPA